MSDKIIMIGEDGEADLYDDTYDITIHCETKEDCDKAMQMLKSMRWIPCSERLPEESGSYFVSGKWASGKVSVGDCEYSKDDGYFQTAWNFDVEAWMPLPEPYRED